MNAAIEALLAKQDIYELSCRYMRGLDRHDPLLMRDQFWADGWCEYGFFDSSPADFIDFCMQALQAHVANQHLIGNVLIELDGEQAYGEVYFQAYHKVPAETGFEDVIIAGRYRDRYERRNGMWKLAYRSEIVDWSRTQPSNDSYFDLAPQCLRGGRQDDPVYRRDDRRKP
ncbi:nuclear transport factor 2 family protein [Seongchinamella unica]|uniref:Nuclear transport factor 2 family protein n=1 Tax=Seongchinamella unica TaxID=2547392 RepID=A0A4R5LUL2_9GAMM|nr:nuclear transport factor 2 family protein [Seongchinamella unica]TDG14878.1 nuclear transport factor 2 family protein [Seongchinamella unica]